MLTDEQRKAVYERFLNSKEDEELKNKQVLGHLTAGITDGLTSMATAEGRARGYQSRGNAGANIRNFTDASVSQQAADNERVARNQIAGIQMEDADEARRNSLEDRGVKNTRAAQEFSEAQKQWARQDTAYDADNSTESDEHAFYSDVIKQNKMFKDKDLSNVSTKKLKEMVDRFGLNKSTRQGTNFGFIQDRDGNIYQTDKNTGEVKLVQEGTPRAKPPKPMNATEAKKKATASTGGMAEDQFQKAYSKGVEKGSNDPTNIFEVIDNYDFLPQSLNFLKSDEALEMQAARDSWVDTFLRDESGAAIPTDERSAYYGIYFPQPGDTPQIVKNKELLRQNKMKEAQDASNRPITEEEKQAENLGKAAENFSLKEQLKELSEDDL